MECTPRSHGKRSIANMNLTDVLNDDVVGLIKDHLPKEIRVWLTRDDYIQNHSVIKQMIPSDMYDQYLHDVMFNDHSFVFTQILHEQFDKFHNWKPFEKNGSEHHSYLTYLRDKCVKFGSLKCAGVIDSFAGIKGFSPNWYKRRAIIISTTDKLAEGHN